LATDAQNDFNAQTAALEIVRPVCSGLYILLKGIFAQPKILTRLGYLAKSNFTEKKSEVNYKISVNQSKRKLSVCLLHFIRQAIKVN